mmetsp:Transcript_11748/g.21119  ORF Transcript_11748/g.21119 Transcript_11748/m.21119 type:complete len:462 (-) Transcript_11748:342-1727(-)|eukprot:CAMPEP_0175055380 /NCGR_PEP_ID=MMETSP0052_2-20121109/10043_1 /TAXON_ID=51329 ORGANISM="Polytomella parva, Strain SAG 63-3" /NCGR_SAMPLE_ID=MMETSP0052_2 /ASSEMBLY_ACC=CAM_ASM_000194 /LENGTH=461 /DNA_ID=CAMNT_0016320209 /DNA_START=285 /DNA_END=1670 /DNA_ORIENTATION=-
MNMSFSGEPEATSNTYTKEFESLTIIELIKELLKTQKDRAVIYSSFNDGFKSFLETRHLPKYLDLIQSSTWAFAQCSLRVNTIELISKNHQREDIAKLIRTLQEHEREKLRLELIRQTLKRELTFRRFSWRRDAEALDGGAAGGITLKNVVGVGGNKIEVGSGGGVEGERIGNRVEGKQGAKREKIEADGEEQQRKGETEISAADAVTLLMNRPPCECCLGENNNCSTTNDNNSDYDCNDSDNIKWTSKTSNSSQRRRVTESMRENTTGVKEKNIQNNRITESKNNGPSSSDMDCTSADTITGSSTPLDPIFQEISLNGDKEKEGEGKVIGKVLDDEGEDAMIVDREHDDNDEVREEDLEEKKMSEELYPGQCLRRTKAETIDEIGGKEEKDNNYVDQDEANIVDSCKNKETEVPEPTEEEVKGALSEAIQMSADTIAEINEIMEEIRYILSEEQDEDKLT